MKNNCYRIGSIRFYPQTNLLKSKQNVDILLENIECKILMLLITSNDKVVYKEDLLNLWKTGKNTSDNSLTYAICKLRKKLNNCSEDTVEIKNIRKKGYIFIRKRATIGELRKGIGIKLISNFKIPYFISKLYYTDVSVVYAIIFILLIIITS